jgi:uncharacterized delta-60 repeat protein
VSTKSFAGVRHPLRRRDRQSNRGADAVGTSARNVVECLEGRVLLTAVLSPVADTFIRNNTYANSNFGGSQFLYVQNASSGDSRVAMMTFDLSSMSAITNATLRLNGTLENPSGGPVNLGVYPVNSTTWTEGAGTTNSLNGNGGTTNSQATGPVTWTNAPVIPNTSIVATPATVNRFGLDTYSWDLTSYLQSLPAGTTTVSLAIEGATAGPDLVRFLSHEAGEFGPQLIVNGSGGTSIPVATVTAPDVTDPTMATVPVSVVYSADAPIDQSTITSGNISVNGPGGPLQVLNASIAQQGGSDNSLVANYTVAAPTGGWTAANNGLYTVTVQAGQVAVSGGGTAAAAQGQFRVAVLDSAAPTSVITASNITTVGASSYQFTVQYSDNVAVDPAWADVDNVQVLDPHGTALKVISAVADINTPGSPRTVTYTVAAPSGKWSADNDGTYTINVLAGQVRDTAGNAAAANTTQFDVNIPIPDTIAPTATISAPSINSPGGTSQTVSVTYADNRAVDVSTINVSNITVQGPNGPVQVTGVQVSATGNGSPVTAVYTVAAPGGTWDQPDNGVYTITVVSNGVKDTSGNSVVTATGSFSVAATLPDTAPPNAQITAPAITTAGASSATITIVYSDNVAVNAASIDTGDITVSGPAGALTVTSAHAAGGNGSPLVATYTVAAPGGNWSSDDNGSYTISLQANQVSDTAGNLANGVSGSFAVNIPSAVNNGPNDLTFNSGQSVNTNFVTEAIVTQSDGKILAVGRQGDLSTGSSRGVIERFNPDGTIDNSFGNHGMIVSLAGVNEAYYAITMQGANHFLVAGTTAGDFVLLRYDLEGNLDSSFGASGRTVTNFGSDADTARGIAISAAGQIVMGGDSGGNFAFARYDAAGHLDQNYAQGGRQLFGVGTGTNNGLGGIVVQSTGEVVAVGSVGSGVVVVRLTSAGEADGTFGNGGMISLSQITARTDLGSPDRSEGIALQASGGILVANRTASGHFGLVRLNPTGTVDTNFGTNGLVTTNFGGDDDADAVIVQSTGQIIVVGTSLKSGAASTAVAVYDSVGNPLTTFGSQGILTLPSDVSIAAPAAKTAGAIAPKSLHVGDIVLRAFGTVTADGRVVIGTSNEAVSATTSSTLRRLIVPGAITAGPDVGVLVGDFGIVNGKLKKLVVTDADGTKITFALTGGTGQVFQNGNRYSLVVNDSGKGVTITITGKGGDGRVSLDDVTVSGTLKSILAKNSDVYSTLHVTGAIGKLTLGNIIGVVWSGGAIASATAGDLTGSFYATGALGKLTFGNVAGTIASGSGVIGSISAASLDNARILSGANLGADGLVSGSGSGANDDTYGAGAIGSLKVKGAIASSFVGAGVNPVDQTFGNTGDQLVGGTASSIGSITAKSADDASRFEAGSIKKAKLSKTIDVTADSRFKILT